MQKKTSVMHVADLGNGGAERQLVELQRKTLLISW